MKKDKGDSRLFLAEIIIIIGTILLSTSLISILKVDVMWSLFTGLFFILIGSAWKSIKK